MTTDPSLEIFTGVIGLIILAILAIYALAPLIVIVQLGMIIGALRNGNAKRHFILKALKQQQDQPKEIKPFPPAE